MHQECENVCLCPLKGIIDVISKKWALLIINAIGNHKRLRFKGLMEVLKAAGEAGLIVLVAGPDVVRLAPSLVISQPAASGILATASAKPAPRSESVISKRSAPRSRTTLRSCTIPAGNRA